VKPVRQEGAAFSSLMRKLISRLDIF